MPVGELIDQGVQQVPRQEVARHSGSQPPCVEDVDVRIPIDAGGPLTAKETAVGRIDLGFESLRKPFQVALTVSHSIFDPEVGVRGHVAQGRRDLDVLVAGVADPKAVAFAFPQGRFWWLQRGGHWPSQACQPPSKIFRVR